MNSKKRKVLETQLNMIDVELGSIGNEIAKGLVTVDNLGLQLTLVSDKIDLIHAYIIAEDEKDDLINKVNDLNDKLKNTYETGMLSSSFINFIEGFNKEDVNLDELEKVVDVNEIERSLRIDEDKDNLLNFGRITSGQLRAIKHLLNNVEKAEKREFVLEFISKRDNMEMFSLIERWLIGQSLK